MRRANERTLRLYLQAGDFEAEISPVAGGRDSRGHSVSRSPSLCSAPSRDNLLVLYFDDAGAMEGAAERMVGFGYPPVEAENPCWTANGAITIEDPDAWRAVLMPQPEL